MADFVERRKHERIVLELQITTECARSSRPIDKQAILVDISEGGMLVRSTNVPTPGDRVSARFTLSGKPLGSAGGVTVRRQDEQSFAVQFRAAEAELLDFIRDLVTLRPVLCLDAMTSVLAGHVWMNGTSSSST